LHIDQCSAADSRGDWQGQKKDDRVRKGKTKGTERPGDSLGKELARTEHSVEQEREGREKRRKETKKDKK
jgi:hypothetical protein